MRAPLVLSTIAVFALCSVAAAQPVVNVNLSSDQDGLTIEPGTTVNWVLTAEVTGDGLGLALISADIAPDAGNPAFDLPPGTAPAADPMLKFDRPAGITNPGEGAPSGFIGVQRGTAGALVLTQVGGGLNTFGEAMPGGTGVGEWVLDPAYGGYDMCNVGRGAPITVVTGSFAAPDTEGTYTFNLQNALANVLTECNAPPAFSDVDPATVNTNSTFTFTVQAGQDWCLGDMNCSGGSPTFEDILFFASAVGNEQGWRDYYDAQIGGEPPCPWLLGDYGGGAGVEFSDIVPFANSVGQACIPYTP